MRPFRAHRDVVTFALDAPARDQHWPRDFARALDVTIAVDPRAHADWGPPAVDAPADAGPALAGAEAAAAD